MLWLWDISKLIILFAIWGYLDQNVKELGSTPILLQSCRFNLFLYLTVFAWVVCTGSFAEQYILTEHQLGGIQHLQKYIGWLGCMNDGAPWNLLQNLRCWRILITPPFEEVSGLKLECKSHRYYSSQGVWLLSHIREWEMIYKYNIMEVLRSGSGWSATGRDKYVIQQNYCNWLYSKAIM